MSSPTQTPIPSVDPPAPTPESVDAAAVDGVPATAVTVAAESSENSLAKADELFEKGSKAIEDGDFVEAVDCLAQALEIRVAHYGELAEECVLSYYKYGCALLYKAQEESDPLGSFPKNSTPDLEKEKGSTVVGESACKEGSSSTGKEASSSQSKHLEPGSSEKATVEEGDDEDDNDENNDDGDEDEEDTAEAEEDESDLDLSWKMLDIARAIVEKQQEETMVKVNILAALAEVSMEREDIETSLDDYLKALSILEHLVDPDNRRAVELNFRICLVLELGSRTKEAIPYCEKAISLCNSRLQRLKEDDANSKCLNGSDANLLSSTEQSDNPTSGENSGSTKVAEEIELLSGILSELEKKLEDMQQVIANPSSVVSEVMKMITSKQISGEKDLPASMPRTSSMDSSQMGVVSGGFDSPTVSTAATNGVVTHLGVVGRGVKRAVVKPIGDEPSGKKPMLDLPSEKDEGKTTPNDANA